MWTEKLKEFNVSDEEFNKFCEKYPDYAKNKELLAKLYLATVKGVKVASRPITGEFKKVSDLVVGEISRLKVLVIQEADRRQYIGCPKCLRKLQASANSIVECSVDGAVKATVLEWISILAGDDTGEVVLDFPPSVGIIPKDGESIAVEGVLTEQLSFIVYRFTTLKEVEEKVTTPIPTPAPTPTPAEVPTSAEGVLTCPTCGKQFKSQQALKLHKRLAHKTVEEKPKPPAPTPAPTPVQPAVQPTSTPTAPGIPDEAVRLTKVAGILQKSAEEFKGFIASKFPQVDFDTLLKTAECSVVNGKIIKSGA
jgi:uncharacterized C2H2 Zn-finger protein